MGTSKNGILQVHHLLFFSSSFNSYKISSAVYNDPPGFGHLIQWVRNDVLEAILWEGPSLNGSIQRQVLHVDVFKNFWARLSNNDIMTSESWDKSNECCNPHILSYNKYFIGAGPVVVSTPDFLCTCCLSIDPLGFCVGNRSVGRQRTEMGFWKPPKWLLSR